MRPLKPVSQQVVVITGASSGIGLTTARRFADRGARVVLAARDGGELSEIAREIRERGGDAIACPTDVASYEQVEALGRAAVEHYGRIDTWVNDAAVAVYARAQDIPIDEFRRIMDVDFFGQVYGVRVALPHISSQGAGAIICIGSVESERALPLHSAYSAAKHALKGFVDALRVELQHDGSEVQLTLIKPSSVNTPFFDHALTRTGKRPRPIAPVYSPTLVADAIVHCAEHRQRDLVIGGGGAFLAAMDAVAAPLVDRVLARRGIEAQQAEEERSPSAPNNLYAPIDGDHRERGDFPERRFSVYTWMRMHPRTTAGLAATVGAIGVAASRRDRRRA